MVDPGLEIRRREILGIQIPGREIPGTQIPGRRIPGMEDPGIREASLIRMQPFVKQNSNRAYNQQRTRRRAGLFKKVYEYFEKCDADAFVILRIRRNGQTFILTSDSQNGVWPPSQKDLVGPVIIF